MSCRWLVWMVSGALLIAAPGIVGAQSAPALRWDAATLGNHRYLVEVTKAADAVTVTIPWRRRDAHPENVAIIVTDPLGNRVANVQRGHIDRESGELLFQARAMGTYAVYYQPYITKGRGNYPTVVYAAPTTTAEASWAKKFGDASRWNGLPRATVLGYEAVDDFDAYTAMERTATQSQVDALLAAHPSDTLWLFPETRDNAVRMFDALPERWAQRGAGGTLQDSALRGEYLSFQIGLLAPRVKVENVTAQLSDLKTDDGAVISARAMTCFNLGGIDMTGKPFTTRVDVSASSVQPLWFGLDVPKDARPGVYRGSILVGAAGMAPQSVPIAITVEQGEAVAHGDSDPSRLTRLRWLDSTLAQDDTLVKPLTAIAFDGSTLSILGREIELGANGLPVRIRSHFDERMTGFARQPLDVLAAPIQLSVVDAQGAHVLATSAKPNVQIDGPARVHWQTRGHAGPLWSEVKASLEADGTLSYEIALTATAATRLSDIQLSLPLGHRASTYELGLGRTGSASPDMFDWKWNVQNNQDGAWIGAVNAGLEFHLRDERYQRPLNTNFYHQQPLLMPTSWSNGGQGGIRLRRERDDYLVQGYSGTRTMQAGETLHYNFVLRVTPFKTIDPPAHFAERYFHKYGDLDAIKAEGANVVNIHHATPINPWINYPFLQADAMRAYVDAAHQRGMRVKIYDTVRELSDRAPELPMLESLGTEIISAGKGGGFSWLQEHLDGSYIAAWHVPENRDAAVINAGQSRWHNYYIEGLNWLARNVGIDGLYLDDVAYDRTTMKRVRKVLQANRPNPLIDLHSANQFNPRDGYINSTLLYMELFPYIDRLWFGEEFDYQKTSPDYWLTELSGIPFGLMGEMLQDDGNPWRGMLFGMTNRLGWSSGSDPRALWKAWDNFGIEQADMVGWWVHDTPVHTDRGDVLATSYVRKGKQTLIALASWAPQTVNVKLHIDWKALGLDPDKADLVAPAIDGYQPRARFRQGETIAVEPGKGWLIVCGATSGNL
jgi:Family of unknown function (DUF6067)